MGGNGINATNTGGAITVDSGAVTSNSATGIIATQAAGAGIGDVQVLPRGIVSGGTIGINAAAVNANNLLIAVGNNVTGMSGNGIQSAVAGGTATVNVNFAGTTVAVLPDGKFAIVGPHFHGDWLWFQSQSHRRVGPDFAARWKRAFGRQQFWWWCQQSSNGRKVC
jgi:hypothetical protein